LLNSSGSDSDTGSEEDEAERQRKQALVPQWARGAKLKEQLDRQYGLDGHPAFDPDTLFPEITTCSLEEIFGPASGRT